MLRQQARCYVPARYVAARYTRMMRCYAKMQVRDGERARAACEQARRQARRVTCARVICHTAQHPNDDGTMSERAVLRLVQRALRVIVEDEWERREAGGERGVREKEEEKRRVQ